MNNQKNTDEDVRQAVLNAVQSDIQESAGDAKQGPEGAKRAGRSIAYNYNGVRISDTVGIMILGGLLLILLLALLRAHKRERNTISAA